MAYISPQTPSNISPGRLDPVRFDNMPLSLWRKTEISVLVERIMNSSEGSEGLDEVREIATTKSKAAILTLLDQKDTVPPKEKVLKIREYADTILLFRHFIFPATFFRIKDFVEGEIHAQDAEPIYDILQQQEQFQEIVLQYGHLSIVTERGNFMKPISDLIQVFQKLPKKKQPIQLIEALQNPETNEKTRKQIQSYYKALKNKQR